MIRTKHITTARRKAQEKQTQSLQRRPQMTTQMQPRPLSKQVPNGSEDSDYSESSSTLTLSVVSPSSTDTLDLSELTGDDQPEGPVIEIIPIPPLPPIIKKIEVAKTSPDSLKHNVLKDMMIDLTIPEIAEHNKTSIQEVIDIFDEVTNIHGPIEPPVVFQGTHIGEVEANVYRLYHLGYKYEAIRACMGIPVSKIHSIIVYGKRSKEIYNPKYFPGHYAV